MRLLFNLYANDFSDLTADKIAKESLAVLLDNLVVASMCNRDYDSQFAEWGDVVNYNTVGDGTANRLEDGGTLTVNDVSNSGDSIQLNQHLTSAFYVSDRDKQRSFAELIPRHIQPAGISLAEQVDRIVSGEAYNFLGNSAGTLGSDPTYNNLVDANTIMNQNKVPLQNRPMAVGPIAQGALLKEAKLTETQTAGDGSPIIAGWIGRGSGFALQMSQTMPSIAASDSRTGAINLGAGYPAGTTTVVVDGFTGAGTDGAWCTIAGVPYRCTSITEAAADITGLVITPGLREAVVDDAVVVVYNLVAGMDVNLGAGYAVGYDQTIIYDNATIAPQLGQGVTFANGAIVYSIIEVTATTILLNRPLEVALVDDDTINLVPAGEYGWGFTPGAVALVNRPLALPTAAAVDAAIAAYDDIAVRVVMTYEHTRFRTLVSVDLLCGIKTQDANRGVILLG